MDKVEPIDLDTLCKWFEDAADSTSDARQLAERDRDYVDNKQWTATEESEISSRGQPVITKNRIRPKVDFLLGTERQSRSDPRAFPREPGDENAAEAATDALRYIADQNKFSQIKSEVFENVIVEGIGAGIVEYDGRDVVIRHVPWDRFFYDPHSSKKDFKDARYMGIIAWVDRDEISEMYPDKGESVFDACTKYVAETYEDKPKHNISWYDKERKRTMLVEVYYREKGRWMRCVYAKKGVLEVGESPYLDEDGTPVNPIEAISCYVDRENNRFGAIRIYISPQDEINKRASKALHLISVRQFVYETGAISDVAKTKRELANPQGGIEIAPNLKFDLLDTNDMATGNLAMLQDAKNEIDSSGANAALQGRENQGASGRAIQARQQGGQIEIGPLFDNIRVWENNIYRQCWLRVRQYWTEQKWVRVTDDENNLKYVGLNQVTTLGAIELEKAEKQGMPLEQLQQLQMQIMQDPAMQQPTIKNNVAEMDMDIIISEQPDVVTLQGETFEALTQLYQANPQAIPFEVILEAAPLRTSVKKKIEEKLAPNPQVAQMQQQMQEMQMQLQQLMAQAELQNKQADTANKAAQAELNIAKAQSEQVKTQQTAAETAAVMMFPASGGIPGEVAAALPGVGETQWN